MKGFVRQFFLFFKDLRGEQERINKTNIIVCTPGRLLQHFDETWNFSCENLKMLSKTKRMQAKVHILFIFSYWWSRSNIRHGFCRDNAFDYSQFTWTKTDITIFCNTNEVIHWIIAFRRRFHFVCRSIRELALVSLKKPVYISANEKSSTSTPANLTQVKRDYIFLEFCFIHVFVFI